MLQYKAAKFNSLIESSFVVSNYMNYVGLLKINPRDYSNIPQDMDQKNPDSFIDAYTLSNPIMIRSY